MRGAIPSREALEDAVRWAIEQGIILRGICDATRRTERSASQTIHPPRITALQLVPAAADLLVYRGGLRLA